MANRSGTHLSVRGQVEVLDWAVASFTRRDGLYLGLVAAAVLLAAWPLLQGQLPSGHDTAEYPARLAEFERAVRDGQWLPRWAPDVDFGFGSPVFDFLPPLIYYLALIPRLLGADLIVSMNLAGLALIGASGLGMYLFAREFAGRECGLLASVAYLFAPFFLVTLYVRHAFTDFSALAILPFCCWLILRLGRDVRRRTFVAASVAVALLLMASFSVALTALPVLGLWLLRHALRRDLRAVLRSTAALVLGALLSGVVWLPAIVEKSAVHSERLLQGTNYYYANHFVEPQQLLFSAWGYGISQPGPNDGFSFALGWSPLGLAVAGGVLLLAGWRSARAETRAVTVWLAATLVYACVMSLGVAQPVWDAVPPLQYLQFPWRFLVFAAFALAALVGLAAAPLRRVPWWPVAAALLGIVLVLAEGLPHAHPEQLYPIAASAFAPAEIARRGLPVTDADEYQPVAVTRPPTGDLPLRLVAVRGALTVTRQQLGSEQEVWSIESGGAAQVGILTFYFPGWAAYADGVRLDLAVEPLSGTMLAELPAGTHTLLLRFEDSPPRLVAKAVSALGIGLLLLACAARRRMTLLLLR